MLVSICSIIHSWRRESSGAMKNNSCKWLAECVVVSMNLSKGHREVTVHFHGLCAKQTKGGKWIERGGGGGGREARVRERWEERGRKRSADLEGRRDEEERGEREKEREKEREGGRGSLRSSIGRFKDDHALSAAHHTTLRTNQPPSDRWERHAVRKPPGNNP